MSPDHTKSNLLIWGDLLSGRQGRDGSQIPPSWHLHQPCLDAAVTQDYDILMGLGRNFALIYKAS